MIRNEEQLEEILSEPSHADTDALAALAGDLLILGVAGKMGPSLAHRARRAAPHKRIIGVARFSNPAVREQLEAWGIETISMDLLEAGALERLPDAPNVIFMAARKFGSTGERGSHLGHEHVPAGNGGPALPRMRASWRFRPAMFTRSCP